MAGNSERLVQTTKTPLGLDRKLILRKDNVACTETRPSYRQLHVKSESYEFPGYQNIAQYFIYIL